ncbi:unnamed protein product [Lactuca virosa]|uniref:Uncharacterized protein n=1 Tax=Lactuca virosa TaxID=75947 RepID=A0AAU9LW84_9ASTR|nr:unnamed protein product [Lactuca virosa]
MKSPKKKAGDAVKVSKIVEKPIEAVKDIPSKNLVPSKSGILKRLKKKSNGPRHSPERSYSFSPTMVRKPHVTHRGVIIRDIPTPVSPSLKKRRVEDVAKHITKKQKKRRLIIRQDSVYDEIVPETQLPSISSQKKSTPEEIEVPLRS